MNALIASIFHGLSHVTTFSGKDTRQQFWPYAIACAIAVTLILMVLALPRFVALFSPLTLGSQTMTPEQAAAMGKALLTKFNELFDLLTVWTTILAVLLVVLLAAAVTRRLHDCGRSALWGLCPLPFLAIGLLMMHAALPQAMAQEEPDLGIVFGLFLNNLLYLAFLAFLIFLLASPAPSRANSFDPMH